MLVAPRQSRQNYSSFTPTARQKKQKMKARSMISDAINQITILKALHSELSSAVAEITHHFSSELKRLIQYFIDWRWRHADEEPQVMTFRKQGYEQVEPKGPPEGRKEYGPSSAIKENLSREFNEIKVLEQRSNYLRKTNERLARQRKSLSNQKSRRESKQSRQFTPTRKEISRYSLHTEHRMHKAYLKPGHTAEETYSSIKQVHSKGNSTSKPRLPMPKDKTTTPRSRIDSVQLKYKVSWKCPAGHQYYVGEALNNQPHGNGLMVRCCSHFPFQIPSKIIQYCGVFEKGKFQGEGVLKLKGGVRFQGSFTRGMRHGEGTIFIGEAGERGYWQYDTLRV